MHACITCRAPAEYHQRPRPLDRHGQPLYPGRATRQQSAELRPSPQEALSKALSGPIISPAGAAAVGGGAITQPTVETVAMYPAPPIHGAVSAAQTEFQKQAAAEAEHPWPASAPAATTSPFAATAEAEERQQRKQVIIGGGGGEGEGYETSAAAAGVGGSRGLTTGEREGRSSDASFDDEHRYKPRTPLDPIIKETQRQEEAHSAAGGVLQLIKEAVAGSSGVPPPTVGQARSRSAGREHHQMMDHGPLNPEPME